MHLHYRKDTFCKRHGIAMKKEIHYNSSSPFKRWTALIGFVIQNTILITALRSSAEFSDSERPPVTSTEVFISEVLKLMIATAICISTEYNYNISQFFKAMRKCFLEDRQDLLRLAVPAVLYTLQNNLQYVIESGTFFLVLYQFKIISTAFFYEWLLSRRIHPKEWLCIVVLSLGISMVESSQSDVPIHHASLLEGSISVMAAILTSGFAGVYFEKTLKSSKSSIWVINIQLSILSSVFGLLMCVAHDAARIERSGFFTGYDVFTALVVLMQAFEGLAVALVVKHANNIHKGFAGSVSIVIATFLDARLFSDDTPLLNRKFAVGSGLVFASTAGFVALACRGGGAGVTFGTGLGTGVGSAGGSASDRSEDDKDCGGHEVRVPEVGIFAHSSEQSLVASRS